MKAINEVGMHATMGLLCLYILSPQIIVPTSIYDYKQCYKYLLQQISFNFFIVIQYTIVYTLLFCIKNFFNSKISLFGNWCIQK